MKKAVLITVVCLMVLMLGSMASAHELWIEVEHMPVADELRVDVSWGHIRDFYDPANVETFSLFVRYPNGQTEELELEAAGVQGRAFVVPQEEGEYVFWAVRAPGTYTPGDGITRLSVQLAKTVFVVGDGPATSTEPTDLFFEIIPDADINSITTGTFSGQALLEGEPVADATVSAYGPDEAIVESETAADGTFSVDLSTPGTWLVKVSFETDEGSTVEGTDYEKTGRTTTLVVEIPGEEAVAATAPAAQEAPAANDGSTTNMILAFIVGVLLGGAVSLFFASKKSNA
ncbi:DUF4198 domain-containing protein [Dethiobacter alkaliphilus]|uniref:Nickel transport complex, NikM subunit, transmembrane n=1 Tax=Dethiobacter alkaliphilus AHT 1 TaxID=555088 RepID=C0GC69_DETAL|nr:DUF4198 domain-containing protein [Dethiobacter alkaliphilus]EEG78804.1 hypothetical protein DealDRAFT_0078 [Dethiobacter alkaliphilus AHT 1]